MYISPYNWMCILLMVYLSRNLFYKSSNLSITKSTQKYPNDKTYLVVVMINQVMVQRVSRHREIKLRSKWNYQYY